MKSKKKKLNAVEKLLKRRPYDYWTAIIGLWDKYDVKKVYLFLKKIDSNQKLQAKNS